MIDTVAIKKSVDLVGLIEADIGPAPRVTNRRPFWNCPFHDDRDPSLTVFHDDDGDRFRCFGCDAHGDAIDWERRRRGLTWHEAIKALGGDINGNSRPTTRRRPRPALKATKTPPDDDWQTAAVQVMLDCEKMLWSGEYDAVVEWLADRGLDRKTLQRWYVGFNPEPRELHGLWAPKGVTIPHWHEEANTIWGIKVRQGKAAESKYGHVKGGTDGLFGADTLAGQDTAAICEGEFDAMLLHAHVGDLVAVVTLGSASAKDIDPWLPWLLPVKTLLIATDADDAGDEAAKYWTKLTKRAQRLRPPLDPWDDGKDITDYWEAGGDLREWIMRATREDEAVQLAHSLDDLIEAWRRGPRTAELAEKLKAASLLQPAVVSFTFEQRDDLR